MFWTRILSIVRSLSTVYTAIGICHTGFADCLLAESRVKFYSKNKFEKLVHLVGYIISLYHNARASECQIICCVKLIFLPLLPNSNFHFQETYNQILKSFVDLCMTALKS